jgi:hypothetical protein
MLSGKTANTNFTSPWFDPTRPEPRIYHTQPGLNQGSTTPNQAWTKDLPHSTRPEPRICRTQPGLNQGSTAPNQAWTKNLLHPTRLEPRSYCTQPGLNQGSTALNQAWTKDLPHSRWACTATGTCCLPLNLLHWIFFTVHVYFLDSTCSIFISLQFPTLSLVRIF